MLSLKQNSIFFSRNANTSNTFQFFSVLFLIDEKGRKKNEFSSSYPPEHALGKMAGGLTRDECAS